MKDWKGCWSHRSNLLEDESKREEAKFAKDDKHWWLTKYETYCGWHKGDTPWQFFPRHLSQKEFLDPWKALQKIRRYKNVEEWKEQLRDLLHEALSDSVLDNGMSGEEALDTWLLLHKLLEATHLIEVRAIKEDKDGPRPKWKKEKTGNKSSKQEEEKEGEEPGDKTHAWAVIREYIAFFGEDGTAEELWEMVKRSLTNEEDETSAHDRSKMIFVYEELKKLVDAVVILYKLRLKQQRKALLQEEKRK
ncbi:MAG: hypothetical protein WDO71_20180 [Bacteroidota bacterium]